MAKIRTANRIMAIINNFLLEMFSCGMTHPKSISIKPMIIALMRKTPILRVSNANENVQMTEVLIDHQKINLLFNLNLLFLILEEINLETRVKPSPNKI